MAADVFISYRGADRVLARKLENRLRSRWGSRVFRDETGLTAGREWSEGLAGAIREARVMLALIGPGWHVSKDADDWVRKELKAAMDLSQPILPVLVGNPDELKSKLGDMPEAFKRQAVIVGPELAGFDLHKIATALGRLGALRTDDAWSLAARRDEMVPKKAFDESLAAVSENDQSLLVIGSSGSGRNALIRLLVEKLSAGGHLVASFSLARSEGLRHSHAVIAGWIKSLSDSFLDLNSPYSVGVAGEKLVEAILKAGPDLLSRRIVQARTLLPLGGTEHDQKILEAVRRSTDRWAPFPPMRLRHQSRGVLERFRENIPTQKNLILVVDHFDSVDSISGELVKDLLDRPIPGVRMIVAAYKSGRHARKEIGWLEKHLDAKHVTKIDLNEENAWGEGVHNLQPWLDAHGVKLTESVEKCVRGVSNPYRALAKLWYLVDNGLVSEKDPRPQDLEKNTGVDGSKKKNENKKDKGDDDKTLVEWVATQSDEGLLEPTDDHLLDHMIAEHVPVGMRKLVEAGALMGRTFSFYAAYAAVEPLTPDDAIDDIPSARERKAWLKSAQKVWEELNEIDPDQSVLSCIENDNGELLVSIAQADLIGHLRNGFSNSDARVLHQRLARYLSDPIEEFDSEERGDQYHRSDLAAEHWSLAERPRDAADAHRRAAKIAELSLAYGESKKHYHSAIRLYIQLLADRRDPFREHEDLLILANCLYRVGQTTRLAGKPGKAKPANPGERRNPWEATDYLEQALARLADLKRVLLDDETDRWPDGVVSQSVRDIPGPNLVRHHLRVYEAVSGHVHLELAHCHEAAMTECRAPVGHDIQSCEVCSGQTRHIRDHLYDALRNAEAAQGEAGSRWLLAAASARLAVLLTDESLCIQRTDSERSHELAVEAFFHIERIIGLRPYTADEQNEFADPVSVAWRSAGRLFRHNALEPRIAEWAFRMMNKHGEAVSATVDMVTDRWLGGFLLSICKPGHTLIDVKEITSPIERRQWAVEKKNISEARRLLKRHRDWSIESGILDWRTPAHLRLYLLELVENKLDPDTRDRRACHLKKAHDQASDAVPRHRRDYCLFKALETLLEQGPDHEEVVKLFREALSDDVSDADKVVEAGSTQLVGMLLRRCPQLVDIVDHVFRPSLGAKWNNRTSELGYWVGRAEQYRDALKEDPILSPCVDNVIERLAKFRLPKDVYDRALETKDDAIRLLDIHAELCKKQEGVALHVLRRDVKYAALMHEWYRGTDPARMLTLASEWNLKVSGEEWANPKLLRGRLASTVLKEMYQAKVVLGSKRFRRISNMVDNYVVGRSDETALAMVFFLANKISEGKKRDDVQVDEKPKWQIIAEGMGAKDGETRDGESLAVAYDIATSDMNNDVPSDAFSDSSLNVIEDRQRSIEEAVPVVSSDLEDEDNDQTIKDRETIANEDSQLGG